MKRKEMNKNKDNKKVKKKKIFKIGAFVLASVLIVGVLLFANSLVGNPISQALAKGTAEKHLEKTYGDTDYELGEVTYSFKDGYYHAHISSPSSKDTNFTLMINGFGTLKYDNYDDYVESGFNTASRIDTEYRKAAETVFASSKFPYNENIGYGELIFITEEHKNAPDVQNYALVTNELTPDAYYNVNDLGKKAGKLTVYIEDGEVTAEKMAEILLGIRKCFDESGLSFYAIDCVLEPVDNFSTDNRVEVMEFRYADIYEEGLIERVEKADKAAKDYYYAWDSEKFEEQP